ncbi:hypothetical protein TDB9533_03765 [Thalassocella blandensis]|nr:hypothetical protein TDB9533_03765 [Thalassocella blandensis]
MKIFCIARALVLLLGCVTFTCHADTQHLDASQYFNNSWLGSKNTFTIAVIPDTQYLFDQDRRNPEVLEQSLNWIVKHSRQENIVFTIHLGDIVNNGNSDRWGEEEMASASDVFEVFDQADIQYGVVAGNHDINGGAVDNERGDSNFLEYFGPNRFSGKRSYCGSTENGYNNCFTFNGGQQKFLLLALDWRISPETIAWAQQKLNQYKDVPTIIATHEILTSANGNTAVNDAAQITGYGQYLWDELIKNNDQIFMTLNGHNWPAGRVTMQNQTGREVFMHLVNYQDRYFSGSGMIRLYEFDMRNNKIDVKTFSPYWLSQNWFRLPPLAKQEAWLNDAANRFTMNVNLKKRFKPMTPALIKAPLPVEDALVEGTQAYWRFEGDAGTPVSESDVVQDLSGNGNDLLRLTLQNSDETAMLWSDQFHPKQTSHGSIFLDGKKANFGAYLSTISSAPINNATFKNGYTLETFVKLPEYCCSSENHWMGIFSRMGTGADLGRGPVNDQWEPNNPLATLTISPSREFQWAVAPFTDPGLVTNWSFRTSSSTWYHVAVVNDGSKTLLYIDGALDQRNPQRLSNGILHFEGGWIIGANHWMNNIEHSFHGWIGETRLVNRALAPSEFLINQ